MSYSRAATLAASLALITSFSSCSAFAPAAFRSSHVRNANRQRQSQLSALEKSDVGDKECWGKIGGAASFLMGLGFMTQIAFADTTAVPVYPQEVPSSTASSNVVVSVGAPSFGGGGSFETLDFSLPSYNDVVGGSTDSNAKKDAPDLLKDLSGSPQKDEEDAAKTAKKEQAAADAKAAKEEAKRAAAEEKAAKEEAKRIAAEEKAAKEQAEAEAKAAKEAEKEARKAAEKEKQRQAVERQKSVKEETTDVIGAPAESSSVEIPDVKLPDLSSFTLPKIDIPKIESPSSPALSAPAADFKVPEIPEISVPDVKMPSFSMPKVDIPKVEAPKFDIPKVDIPKVDIPKVDVPPPPSFDIPSQSSGPISSSVESNIEPQEVRDARAAEKKTVLKEAEKEASAAEKAAREARERAKEAKKDFKQAKGEACATRPGGKILCLRGFNVGY